MFLVILRYTCNNTTRKGLFPSCLQYLPYYYSEQIYKKKKTFGTNNACFLLVTVDLFQFIVILFNTPPFFIALYTYIFSSCYSPRKCKKKMK